MSQHLSSAHLISAHVTLQWLLERITQAQYWREISVGNGNGATTNNSNPMVEKNSTQHTNGHDPTTKMISTQDPVPISAKTTMTSPKISRSNGNGVAVEPTADRNGHCGHFFKADSVDSFDSVDQDDGGKQPAVMSVASMMLDAQADLLDSLERPEILSIIDGVTPSPVERPKVVVELGAGIGRFTADLARRATWLTALDFLPHALAANVQAHARQHPNVDFVCADVADATSAALLTRLAPDLVFSNWLLMYLSDSEAFSEAHCPIHQSQSQPQQQYEEQDEGGEWRFRLREMRSVAAYSHVKGCQTQVCWVWQKVQHTTQSKRLEREGALVGEESRVGKTREGKEREEQQQYSLEGILCYEHIYGRGFVSTGGRASTLALLPLLSLTPEKRVLDVGCGLGGSALLMAETYGASVHAIDVSPTMVQLFFPHCSYLPHLPPPPPLALLSLSQHAPYPTPIFHSHPLNQVSLAIERSRKIRAADATSAPTSALVSASVPMLQFEVADCLTRNFPHASFDCIYTRDTLLHIQDKPFLFSRFHRWLKPGGRVLITDYCSGKDKVEEWSEEFRGYVAQRGYHLVTIRRYSEMLQADGFHVLKAMNRCAHFSALLHFCTPPLPPQSCSHVRTLSGPLPWQMLQAAGFHVLKAENRSHQVR
ncbi:unnamed protein product [Closterium sp. Yama58-4]|nr:unnamed protein product [Closterium sp. Yama58-4]